MMVRDSSKKLCSSAAAMPSMTVMKQPQLSSLTISGAAVRGVSALRFAEAKQAENQLHALCL